MIIFSRNIRHYKTLLLTFFVLFCVTRGSAQNHLEVIPMGWTIDVHTGGTKGVVVLKNNTPDTLRIERLKYNGRNTVTNYFGINKMTLLPQMGMPVEWINRAVESLYGNDMQRFCESIEKGNLIQVKFEVQYFQKDEAKREMVTFSLDVDDLRNCTADIPCCTKEKDEQEKAKNVSTIVPLGTYLKFKGNRVREFIGGLILTNTTEKNVKIKSIQSLNEHVHFKLWSPVSSMETINSYYNSVSPKKSVLIHYKANLLNENLDFKEWKKKYKTLKVIVNYDNGDKEVVRLMCSKELLVKVSN